MSIKGLGHEGTAVIEVIPCEQKFLSSMPFIIYEVARVVGQSRSFSWGLKQTNHASYKTRERIFSSGFIARRGRLGREARKIEGFS